MIGMKISKHNYKYKESHIKIGKIVRSRTLKSISKKRNNQGG